MVDQQIIKDMYDKAVLMVKDYSNPYANLMNPYSVIYEARHVEEIVRDNDITSMADLGCGSANIYRLTNSNIMRGVTYTGYDLNPNFVKYCSLRYPTIQFHEYDISTKNLKESYDLIIMYEVLPYFTDDEIIDMIDYYYTKTNKVLSFVLLDKGNYDPSLNLIQVSCDDILRRLRDKYSKIIMDYNNKNCKAYVDIYREEE